MKNFFRNLALVILLIPGFCAHAAGGEMPGMSRDAVPVQAAAPEVMDMGGHMGSPHYGKFLLDRLEWQDASAATPLHWDAQAWWGGDVDRAGFSSEGERHGGSSDEVKSRLFWSHAVSPWWDATLGLRHDGGEGPDRNWATVGVKGMAPYFFDVDAIALVGTAGRTALQLQAEYELLFSDRLILQPRAELNAYGRSDPDRNTGSGLSDSSVGLRLRYEICREFAPYLGLEWLRRYGASADMASAAGSRTAEARAVAGVRLWF